VQYPTNLVSVLKTGSTSELLPLIVFSGIVLATIFRQLSGSIGFIDSFQSPSWAWGSYYGLIGSL